MKISTKGRYGLRSLVDIVINSNGDHVPLCKIAERQNISENYLEQIFSTLRRSGIVKSVKGSQGGYLLVKNPELIKVGDVLRSLEGNLTVIDSNLYKDFNNIESCLKRAVWDRLDKVINDVVDSITIEDIVDEYKRINEENTYTYII